MEVTNWFQLSVLVLRLVFLAAIWASLGSMRAVESLRFPTSFRWWARSFLRINLWVSPWNRFLASRATYRYVMYVILSYIKQSPFGFIRKGRSINGKLTGRSNMVPLYVFPHRVEWALKSFIEIIGVEAASRIFLMLDSINRPCWLSGEI